MLMSADTWIHAHTNTYDCARARARAYTNTHTHTHTHTHTYIHIHTHTHTHVDADGSEWVTQAEFHALVPEGQGGPAFSYVAGMSDDDGACGNDAISRADYDAIIVEDGGRSGSGSWTDTGWNTGVAGGSG